MFVEAIILVASVLLAIAMFNYITRPANLPPGPIPLPLIGNLPSIAGSDLHLSVTKLAHAYGDVFTLDFLGDRYVFISSGKEAKEALIGKRMNDFAGRPQKFTFHYLTRGAKDVIFVDYSPSHTWRRKIVHSGLRMYSSSLESSISHQVQTLEEKFKANGGRPICSRQDFLMLVANIICSFLCGKVYSESDEEFPKVLEFIKLAAEVPLVTVLDMCPWLIHFPLKSSHFFKKLVSLRDEILDKIFYQHKSTFSEENIRDLTDAFLKAKIEVERDDRKAVGMVTDDHVIMLMNDVFAAGLESTTTTLRWTIAYLIHYPEIQVKIQENIDDVIGERWPSLSDRSRLPYMEALIAEVLRISTPTPVVIRSAMVDTRFMGYTIPKGTNMAFNLWAMNHDPRQWEEPEVFNPDRFLNPEGRFEVPLDATFIPFLAGRRVCIGESLVKTELFLILTRLLQQFTFASSPGSPPPDLEGDFGVTYFPKPYKYCVKPRF